MKVFWWYLLAFLLFSVCSNAQTTNYSILHYTTDNGLPQNSIKAINFDKAGYCWLGTELGLVRFDGDNFQTFNSNNIEGLKSDRVVAVAKDMLGNAYAELESGQQLAIILPNSGGTPFPNVQKQKICFSRLNNLVVKPPRITEVINNFVLAPEYGGMDNFCIATSDNNVYVIVDGKVFYVSETSLKLVTVIDQSYRKRLAVIDGKLVFFQPGGKIKVLKNGIIQPDVLALSGPLYKNKAFRSGDYKMIQSAAGSFLYAGKLYTGYIWKVAGL